MNTLLAAAALAAVLAGSLGAPTANLLRPDAVGAKPSGAALPGAIRQIPLVLASSHSKASRDQFINEMYAVCLEDCHKEVKVFCHKSTLVGYQLEAVRLQKAGKAFDIDDLTQKWEWRERRCVLLAVNQGGGEGYDTFSSCQRKCKGSRQRLLNRPYP